MLAESKPKLAVWKFASCDGCQLSLLDCEDELLSVVGEIDIAYFLEATRVVKEGPYDLSLVEGSITTPEDLQRIRHIRDVSKVLVTIGACATAGGIQALRNFADVNDYISSRLRAPRIHQHAGALHAHRRPCLCRFRAARLPHQQVPVGRGDQRLSQRAQAQHSDLQRLHGVQAARQRSA